MKNQSIHRTAIISQDSVLGDNIKVWHFTHIRENVKVGNNVSIGQNVYIDKNVTIGQAWYLLMINIQMWDFGMMI